MSILEAQATVSPGRRAACTNSPSHGEVTSTSLFRKARNSPLAFEAATLLALENPELKPILMTSTHGNRSRTKSTLPSDEPLSTSRVSKSLKDDCRSE